jgi:hypothetical protein
MSSYDMNENKDDVFHVKLLSRKVETNSGKFPTFGLSQFAKDNHISELMDILVDIDIYFDLNDEKRISGIEVVTFYDD